MAIAALVLGIVAVPLFLIAVVGVLAVVLGAVALSRVGRSGRPGRGLAVAGVVLGTLSIMAFGVAVAVVASNDDGLKPTSSSPAPATTVPATTTSTLAALVPAGFTGFTQATDRFTVSVPSDWRQIDPSSPGAAQATRDLVKHNPAFAPVLGSGSDAQDIKFFAVDSTGKSVVNVGVMVAVGARDSDLPKQVDDIKAEYRKFGATVTSTRSVPLSGHTALQVNWELRLTGAGGASATIRLVQYIIAANDLLYILTLSGDSPQLSTVATTLRVS